MQQGLLLLDSLLDIGVDSLVSADVPDLTTQREVHTIDDQLAKATLQVLETGRLTPLIKEELKCKIQARRHSEGQGEYKVEFKRPRTYTLTNEEQEKVVARKERNRIAALKFRRKRKNETVGLESEVESLSEANRKLQQEFETLSAEKEHLLFALSQIKSPSNMNIPPESQG